MGSSIGKWEGDTFVVDTIGFNDKTWLDRLGHPHAKKTALVERFRRVDANTLQIDLTIDDPRRTRGLDVQLRYRCVARMANPGTGCEDDATFTYLGKIAPHRPSNRGETRGRRSAVPSRKVGGVRIVMLGGIHV